VEAQNGAWQKQWEALFHPRGTGSSAVCARAHVDVCTQPREFEPSLSVRSVRLWSAGCIEPGDDNTYIHTLCTSYGLRSVALLFHPSLSFLAGRAACGLSRVWAGLREPTVWADGGHRMLASPVGRVCFPSFFLSVALEVGGSEGGGGFATTKSFAGSRYLQWKEVESC
jgi:hypothetical protein